MPGGGRAGMGLLTSRRPHNHKEVRRRMRVDARILFQIRRQKSKPASLRDAGCLNSRTDQLFLPLTDFR